MNSKLLGGILLITGISIGAGMLGLPIAAAQLGFTGALILLTTCWVIMLTCSFLILEVNQWLPENTNIISMAKITIGPSGQVVAWLSYTLLLYSLLCAYIAGGSDLFHNLLKMVDIDIPLWGASVIFTVFFGSIVYAGINLIDKTNRFLMLLKFATLFAAIFFLVPFISSDKLADGNLQHLGSVSAISVTAAAFGWATLVPSLRVYFSGDLKKIKIAFMIGSLIPLICYIIWDAAIMGVIPLFGENSLEYILQSSNSTSNLVDILSITMNSSTAIFFIKVFTAICVLTSFLGVALCLIDFLADGLKVEKKSHSKFMLHFLTFFPALLIAILFPNAFIKTLEYAGVFASILLILLPAWMAWCGRYKRGLANGFTVLGGKSLLAIIIIFSLVLIISGIIHK